MKQLRDELTEINRAIAELQLRGSKDSKQLLLNLYDEKKRELDVHDKNKPAAVAKPEGDPQQQKELQEIAKRRSKTPKGAERT